MLRAADLLLLQHLLVEKQAPKQLEFGHRKTMGRWQGRRVELVIDGVQCQGSSCS